MSPKSKKKIWKKKRKSQNGSDVVTSTTISCAPDEERRLQELLAEMEAHMALDRILEAREVLDQMEKEGLLASSSIPEKQRDEINHIMKESDHIQELLHDLLTGDGWTKSKFSRHGIDVHARKVEGTPIFAVKTHTILEDCPPADFVRFCTFFAELDLMPKWFPLNMLDVVEVLAEPSKYRKVFRMVIKFPRFLPMSDRDVFAEGAAYHVQKHNAFLIFSKSIQSSPFCETPPQTRGVVRIKSRAVFFVQLLPGDRVGFSFISHDDLKLKFVPAFVLNYISQGAFPFDMTTSLKRCLANYDGSEWHTRLESRRDYYGEIEQRVHEQVAVMEKRASVAAKSVPKTVKRDTQKRSSDVKVTEKESSPRSFEGIPLWKAILTINVLVTCTRWSVESGVQLPSFVYAGFFALVVPLLTHSVVVYRLKTSPKHI